MEGAAERSEAGLASFLGGEAATFIPNSSFEQSFHLGSRDNTSRGLPPNPEPRTITRIYYVKEHPIMPTPQIRNIEGIVLRASKGGEGGRSLSLFTREIGLILSLIHI